MLDANATCSRNTEDGSDKVLMNSKNADSRGCRRNYSESDESSEEEEFYQTYQQYSISTVVLGNVKIVIDRLYKLSFKIRDPATRLGFSNARSYRLIDEETGVDLTDYYTSLDLRHITKIVARNWQESREVCGNHYLVQRLARANTNRRRQIGYWQNQAKTLKRQDHSAAQTNPVALQVQAMPDSSSKKGLPTSHSINDGHLKEAFRVEDFTPTRTALKAPPNKDEEADVCIPVIPTKLLAKEEFECPYCGIPCARRFANQSTWE